MRVLLDTNVWLSYMLSPTSPRVITTLVSMCLDLDEIELMVPQEQIAELATALGSKRYFRSRIPHAQIESFLELLSGFTVATPPLDEIVSYVRDPKDDYLVTFSIVHDVDYLVTGDRDLLILEHIGDLKILEPAAFLSELGRQGLLS